MGANIARNAARNGASTVLYNRTESKTAAFMQHFAAEGLFTPTSSYIEFIAALKAPRVILIMVKSGSAVDGVITDLLPLLEPGDVLMDGGNSHYPDTKNRYELLQQKSIEFLGLGVSGGEEGALSGPSMMPGGSEVAWKLLKPLLTSMAATDASGGKCIAYLGKGGAGHFVKMVHNGIEYGVMQLIAESYDVLKRLGTYSNQELAQTFTNWNEVSFLNSFLIEITSKIFTKEDELKHSGELIDVIADVAAQKGTGKWTTQAALDYGVAIPTITAAVDARILSGSTFLRSEHKNFPFVPDEHTSIPAKNKLATLVRSALKQSILCSYLQGFALIAEASAQEDWGINLQEVARIWQGGCIIRSDSLPMFERLFMSDTSKAMSAKEQLLDRFTGERQLDWRAVVTLAIAHGIPVPAMAASLNYLDTLHTDRLPQSLIQAQRDLFGAHTFKRTDAAGDFHSEW